jgi:sugar phosphate permease
VHLALDSRVRENERRERAASHELTVQTWIVAIAVILVLQTVCAYLSRLVPIVSPAFMVEFGWDESWIGYLTAANIVGALFVLFACIGLIQRLGSVLALQLSLLVGAASLLLFHVPSVALALLASALIGLSNGTANPAGAEVLQRYTPPAHRNFVFSIKQAGVPLGGVLAGLTIPPLVEALGWRTALIIAAAVSVAATLLMLPFRARIDGPREPGSPRAGGLRLSDLAVPLRSLKSGPGLLRVSLVGGALSIAQSCWFTFAVTYLVVEHRMSLGAAGLVFAVMQACGVVGRIVMGWIADHLASSTTTLASASVMSAAATVLLGLFQPGWPAWSLVLLAAVAGATVSGWNGVQIAEVARRSPRHLVGETAAGSVVLVFLGNMLAPIAFAAFVAATRRFDLAFVAAGACSLLCLPLLLGIDRTSAKSD